MNYKNQYFSHVCILPHVQIQWKQKIRVQRKQRSSTTEPISDWGIDNKKKKYILHQNLNEFVLLVSLEPLSAF